MAEFTVTPYSPLHKREWDSFVATSKNGTLLHRRDYLGYHSDRFPDASLMIMRDGKLYALLPATFDGSTFSSHDGLTFGGLILGPKAGTSGVLRAMELVRDYVSASGAREFIYKPVPHIYHTIPAEEDLYALFRLGATLTVRNVSAAIFNVHRPNLRTDHKAGVRKALEAGVSIRESADLPLFWEILTRNLKERHNACPVHSLEEMTRLKSMFPEDIRLHLAFKDNEAVGGAVVYVSPTVAHTQYISATPEGRSMHALDLLLHTLATDTYATLPYFDFGTSNEDRGRVLNENLILQKEGFGARAVIYDAYSIPLSPYNRQT